MSLISARQVVPQSLKVCLFSRVVVGIRSLKTWPCQLATLIYLVALGKPEPTYPEPTHVADTTWKAPKFFGLELGSTRRLLSKEVASKDLHREEETTTKILWIVATKKKKRRVRWRRKKSKDKKQNTKCKSFALYWLWVMEKAHGVFGIWGQWRK